MGDKCKANFQINKALLPIKGMTFLWFGAIAALFPYMTIHMKKIGITIEETAIIYALLPVSSFIGPPIMGIIADKFGRYKCVLITFLIITTLCHIALLFIPSTQRIKSKNLETLQFNYTCNGEISKSLLVSKSNLCNSCNELKRLQLPIVDSAECINICPEIKDSLQIEEICFISNYSGPETNCYSTFNSTNKSEMLYNNNLSVKSNNNILSYKLDTYLVNISTRFSNCSQSTNNCYTSCSVNVTFNNKTCSCEITIGNGLLTFWVYFILRLLSNITAAIVFTLLDSSTYTMVRLYGGTFGQQRVWALIGLLVFSPLAGLLVDYVSYLNGEIDYSPAFYSFVVLSLLTAFFCSVMNIVVEIKAEQILKHLGILLRDFEIEIFLMTVLIMGAYWGFSENFVFWYLNDLKAPTYLLGLTITVGCLAALPVVHFSSKIIDKIGHVHVMMLAYTFYGLRFIGYSFITKAEYSLILEIFEAFTIHLMWISASLFASVIAPPGMLASLQGIMAGVHFGIGKGVGSFLGGFLMKKLGPKLTFLGMGISSLVIGLIYLIIYHAWLKNISTRNNQTNEDKCDEPNINTNDSYKMKHLDKNNHSNITGQIAGKNN